MMGCFTQHNDDQRPGQRLINYIRFIKDRQFYLVNGEDGRITDFPADGERYLWNMSHKEFDEVMSSSWEDLVKKYGVPEKFKA